MFKFGHKRHLFYLLAAIVLLLQSFAVWHDAQHPFHTAEAQCERLNAISHLPGADLVPDLAVSTSFVTVSVDEATAISTLPARQREQHPIRAPPAYS
ncbi:hypothetical protein [Methylophaga sp. OBS4]|uniref:hypothetical protein n=1 Tax=Methylophaga sp. OBS4 TaxID=2991935 RepID=UPI002258AB78|nr:hypothetical protein [Methylophaga sp. OBS4]MCX4188532.1 hypothetical protein [Methylophaga sp. OBS4]